MQLLGVALLARDEVVALAVKRALALLHLLDLGAQLDLLQQIRVAGGCGLHFAGRQLHVLEGVVDLAPDLAGAQLVDGLELGFLGLPHAQVQGVLGHIGQDLRLKVLELVHQLVALADDAAFALLQV